jgi:small subunit ribosomal protein S17
MQVRTSRKILNGRVVSTKNNKTIVVSVETYKKHPLYSKRFKSNKKYQAHDENNIANVGDSVMLSETKPYSKTKKFRLVKILEKAKKGGGQ